MLSKIIYLGQMDTNERNERTKKNCVNKYQKSKLMREWNGRIGHYFVNILSKP